MSHLGLAEPCAVPLVHEGHQGVVYSVAFSPDSKSVASGSMDRTVRVWDAHRPSSNGDPYRGHNQGIQSVSYSSTDNLIASGSRDRSVRIWKTDTGRQEIEPWEHPGEVNSVAFSPDGNLLASGSSDHSVRLWNIQGGSSSGPFSGHYGRVNTVGFSPDGTYIASGSDDTTIRIWDAQTRTTISGTFQGHSNPVCSVSYSPNGFQIVSGSADSTIRLWDSRSGKMTTKPYEGHMGSVCSVAFSPSGLFVASGSFDQTIRIWDIRTGRLAINPIEGHTGYIYSVAFSPLGDRIASGSNDGKVMIWSIPGGLDIKQETEAPLESHGGPLKAKMTERVSRDMPMKKMFDLLIQHGCVNMSSQIDSTPNSHVVVGGGGFGDIWKGQLHDGTKVAIKVWRASMMQHCDDKTLKRAAREVYYWSRMKHENVHQLLGVIIFRENSLGMVSEWMENGNLREHMRNADITDPHSMCASIATGLAYMHQCDAVHGDLKAASNSLNVLVSSDGIAKLADFGLSTVPGASLGFSETSNAQIGSTRWAAPELLFDDGERSKEADVYALGMTMLEVITGDVPYPQCQQDFQVIAKVMQGTRPTRPMTQLKENERGNKMWDLLLSCWSREPGDRPSAQQVLESMVLIRALPE